MGKRKKASKPQTKKSKAVLPSSFNCLFCNHENSVSVKMDKKAGTGELSCKVCGQQFQTGINYLSAAVDVYSDWIDACDAVAKDATERDDDTQPISETRQIHAERHMGVDDEDDEYGEAEYDNE